MTTPYQTDPKLLPRDPGLETRAIRRRVKLHPLQVAFYIVGIIAALFVIGEIIHLELIFKAVSDAAQNFQDSIRGIGDGLGLGD